MRYYYDNTIEGFLEQLPETILGAIVCNTEYDVTDTQRNAWLSQIDILKAVLSGYEGQVYFEYNIPRMGKRIDVVVITHGIIFCLEFKVGETAYNRADVEQVWDYALDLKNFHEASHDKLIVPVLVATDARNHSSISHESISCYDNLVFNPLMSNTDFLPDLLAHFISEYEQDANFDDWGMSRYSPTPTIIQAASVLYAGHNVEEITRTEAAGASLQQTTDYVMSVIRDAAENKRKSICFVTGVPGAGKTLVGLNVAMQVKEEFKPQEQLAGDEEQSLGVYLSGNGPLVQVLTEALARDDVKRGNTRYITQAREKVKSFIQSIHRYRDEVLQIVEKPVRVEVTEADGESRKGLLTNRAPGNWIRENVAIFDEAQRCWNEEHLKGWLKRKRGIENFPMSEAEFLIWSLDLRKDWAVIVCLVGGGQHINTGEAGIAEWVKAIKESFPHWNVFISPDLKDDQYGGETLSSLLNGLNQQRLYNDKSLHLAVSNRSFRSELVADFVHALLANAAGQAKGYYSNMERFPIVLTRDIDKAKAWLKAQAKGSERYGVVVSSQAYRLRPLAIDVRVKPDTVSWFLEDKDDIRSSMFMEDIATEFDVQGLELDYTCLVWDGDLRYTANGWKHAEFKGAKWRNILSHERQEYQLNAYRVLLTRARQGMVICVPEGNSNRNIDGTLEDPTRNPEFYDGTYEYLKSLGIIEI